MDKLIDRVKEIRQELNVSQEEFADFIGISRATILRIENKKCEPRLRTLFKIKRFCEENNIELKCTTIQIFNKCILRKRENHLSTSLSI